MITINFILVLFFAVLFILLAKISENSNKKSFLIVGIVIIFIIFVLTLSFLNELINQIK